MKIQEICRRTGLNKRTVHFYIREGLLNPASDPNNHYYDFSEEDSRRLQFIHDMRNAGLTLAAISSMLKNPATAGYYLNLHIGALKKKQLHIEQTLVSLRYMLDNMPIYPDFTTLSLVTTEAGIPERTPEAGHETSELYNTAVINRLLWAGFLPDSKLTEYQQFLWTKLNRISMETPSEDYSRLGRTLSSMSTEQIEALFNTNNERHRYIVELTEDTISVCAREMIRTIWEIVANEGYVRAWKKYCFDFYEPVSRIQASELSLLVMEISSFYKAYVEHIVKVCDMVYRYLHSDEGSRLRLELEQAFGDTLNLEIANHGQLEALVSVPFTYRLIR